MSLRCFTTEFSDQLGKEIEAGVLSVVQLALLGWRNSPHALTVRAHCSIWNNALAAVNQLMMLNVKWK
ncbi:MAG: hypothetical protein M3347_15195 [Armatimonadota bacterium]|nr:hypothetical protein [Armatimonadota bacterium]